MIPEQETYQQQLTRMRDEALTRAVRAERDVRAAEDELGKRRRQVAELIEQRDRAQAGAQERAVILEHARDLLEPWGGHGDSWPDIAPAIEELISEARRQTTRAVQAEARIAAVQELHRPVDGLGYHEDGRYEGDRLACSTCGTPDEYATWWPCPTMRTLDGADATAGAQP
ncbi:hypothetical protein [Kitasatospora aureofaciens]|uniref:hypothetical protein n=1 Tax=Kitasatospora aureofaciens TaxID=1894 RepID=UPI0033EB38A6